MKVFKIRILTEYAPIEAYFGSDEEHAQHVFNVLSGDGYIAPSNPRLYYIVAGVYYIGHEGGQISLRAGDVRAVELHIGHAPEHAV